MDAYDILKKLSIGLKFKPRSSESKLAKKTTQPVKPEAHEIKNEEPLKTELYPDDNKSECSSEDDSNSESEEIDSENDKSDEIQILEGVKLEKKKKKKVKEKSEDLKKKLELEEENCYRNTHNIKAVGRHIAPALRHFSDLHSRYHVSTATLNTVTKCGYVEPTPVQRQALPAMLEDRQILTIAPTGSGKTAAFLIPILHALKNHQGGPRALILCPTRELAVQIYREALRLSEGTDLRCTVVKKMQQSKIKERESTIKKSDIVISTPNRLCYLLNQENVNIQLNKVHWLVIDEADKLFEGSSEQESDFRQQMEQILSACDSKGRRIAMFSATHSAPIAKWARRNMRGLINISVGHRNTATNMVEQELLYCGNESGKLIAFRQLVQKGLKPPVLIFVQSKDRAKQLFKELIYDGINVDVIHADRTQAQRDNVVRSFRIGKIWVLICTELMGRGIDFHGVSLVINYDFPPSAVAYIHRVGRAGRAGQKGKAVTFFTQDDFANLRSIASVMRQSGCNVPDYMLKLKKNVNLQKRLLKRAPSRDKISTVLEKNAMKRRMELRNQEIKEQGSKKFKHIGTDKIENAKRSKQRKVENGKGSVKKTDFKRNDKKEIIKKHKKPFVKKKSNKNVL